MWELMGAAEKQVLPNLKHIQNLELFLGLYSDVKVLSEVVLRADV